MIKQTHVSAVKTGHAIRVRFQATTIAVRMEDLHQAGISTEEVDQ